MSRTFDASKVRIATFDLDGTVLNNGIMSKKVEQALSALSKMGIAVTLATGRDISQIPKNVLKLFEYRITNNGSHVCSRDGKTIVDQPIDRDTTCKTIKLIRRLKGYSCIYLNGKVIATPTFLLRIISRTDFASKSHRSSTKDVRKGNSIIRFSLIRFLEKHNVGTYKIQSFFKNRPDAEKAAAELGSTYDVNPVLSHDICLETMDKGVSKANGLLELCKALGCTAQNVISFGDSANDLDILKTSGYAVAMGNAESCLKQIADQVSENVADDGVAKAIDRLFNVR